MWVLHLLSRRMFVLHLPLQVKAAFTRAYNKESHLTPYALQVVKKGRRGTVDAELGEGELEQESQELAEEEQEDVTTDAMIKVGGTDMANGFLFLCIFTLLRSAFTLSGFLSIYFVPDCMCDLELYAFAAEESEGK